MHSLRNCSDFETEQTENVDLPADEEELDFDGFMRLLKADKVNNLAYFESRLPKSESREPRLGQADLAFSSELYGQRSPPNLPSVAEHRQL